MRRKNNGVRDRAGGQLRVSFSDMPTEVWEVSELYPSNFFYNECDVSRFRRELKEECASTPEKDTSTSWLIIMAAFAPMLALIATAFCLPLLLCITLVHVFNSYDDAADSSIQDMNCQQHILSQRDHEHLPNFTE